MSFFKRPHLLFQRFVEMWGIMWVKMFIHSYLYINQVMFIMVGLSIYSERLERCNCKLQMYAEGWVGNKAENDIETVAGILLFTVTRRHRLLGRFSVPSLIFIVLNYIFSIWFSYLAVIFIRHMNNASLIPDVTKSKGMTLEFPW